MDELRAALRDAANAVEQHARPDFSAVIRRAQRRRTSMRVVVVTTAAAVIAGLVILVLLLSPGTDQRHTPAASPVRGHLVESGGPEGAQSQTLRGVVTARGPHNAVVQVRTAGDGEFTVDLAPGRWQLSATSPQYFAGSVRCTAQVVVPTTRPVTITCPMK